MASIYNHRSFNMCFNIGVFFLHFLSSLIFSAHSLQLAIQFCVCVRARSPFFHKEIKVLCQNWHWFIDERSLLIGSHIDVCVCAEWIQIWTNVLVWLKFEYLDEHISVRTYSTHKSHSIHASEIFWSAHAHNAVLKVNDKWQNWKTTC